MKESHSPGLLRIPHAGAPGRNEYRFKLVARPEAVRVARTLVSSALIHWRLTHLDEDGKLVTSELVSNAGAAAPHAEIWLGVHRAENSVSIGVWDPSDREPIRAAAGLTDTSGRGLLIVAALAAEHGWYRVEPHGKVVWARFTI